MALYGTVPPIQVPEMTIDIYIYIFVCPYDIPIIHIHTSYHIISVYYIPPGDSEYAIIKKISIVSLCHQT